MTVKLLPSIIATTKNIITMAVTALPNAITMWKEYIDTQIMGAEAIELASGAVVTANQAIQASIPIIGLALTAFSGLYMAFNYFNKSAKSNTEILKENAQAYEESQSKVDELSKSLSDVNNKIAEINSKGKLSITDEKDLTNLRIQREELEQQLKVAQAINEEKKKAYEKSAKKTVYDDVYSKYVTANISKELGITKDQWNDNGAQTYSTKISEKYGEDALSTWEWQGNDVIVQKASDRVEQLKAISSAIQDYQKTIDNLSLSKEKNGELSKEEQKQLDDAVKGYQEAYKQGADYSNQLIEETKDLDKNSETRKYAYEGITPYTEAIGEMSDATSEATQLTNEQVEAMEEEESVADYLTSVFQDLDDKISAFGDSIDLKGIEDAFTTVRQAQEEMNGTGTLTVKTYEKLMSLSSDYIAVLFDEQGNLRTTAEAEYELYSAKIDMMAIEQAEALIKKAVNIETQNGAGAYVEYAKSVATSTDVLWDNVYASLADIKAKGKLSKESYYSILNQVKSLKSYASQAKANIKLNGTYSKSIGDVTSATNKNTDALNKQKEALESQKDNYDSVISYIKDKIKDYIDVLEDERDTQTESIEKQIDNVQKLKDAETDSIDAQIDKLKDLQDIQDKNIESQINNLKDLQSKEEDYWQAKIDALQNQNDELESQIELEQLLDNLAKARATKKKVYREGQGFVYEQDIEGVSKAQQELSEYYSKKQYQDKLDALNKFKDDAKNNYDIQIKNLEDYQEKVKDSYDAQIKALENQKTQVKNNYDAQIEALKLQEEAIKQSYNAQIEYYQNWENQFKDAVNSYENQQNRLMALELTGIDFEAEGWQTRLGNLGNFINGYNSLLGQLNSIQQQINATTQQISSDSANATNNILNAQQALQGLQQTMTTPTINTVGMGGATNVPTIIFGSGSGNLPSSLNTSVIFGSHANGTYGTKQDEIALVGENPNTQELAIGSKLNSGTVMPLQKGTGIIPHNLTSTLIEMASAFNMSKTQPNNSIDNSKVMNITISNMNVETKDGKGFVDYLQNFSTSMIQKAY